MKRKYIFQVVQDAFLLMLVGALFGFHLWGEALHEWLGVALLLLIALHCVLNVHWFKRIAKGEYDLFRRLRLLSTGILMVSFVLAAISGLMLSQYVAPDAFFHNSADLIRKIHMTSVHWMQVLIAVHLGMHWKMLAGFFSKIWHIYPSAFLANRLIPFVFILVSLYGFNEVIERQIHTYLLMQVNYSFFDFDESKLRFYLGFFSIVIAVAYLTRILTWMALMLDEKASRKVY
ncbi:DUF4405 domain-containing protein [Vibrio diazotrophicus]|uniref:DUF4405 domain-containing protein n=1 Tax=Vibrio diazotrophicus TaxID=685 RepID=UPI0005AB5857|nr:DUF4405 domain-containing protein [Vibrio diazotrophicus]